MNLSGPIRYLALALCLALIGCSDPQLTPTAIQPGLDLAIVYPLDSTEIAGGQSFRLTVFLNDADDDPVEGASVEAALWSPAGDLHISLPCVDSKYGRYLTDYISLPLRNSRGTWRVTARAVLEDGRSLESEGEFIGHPSYSERLEENFGFWIELTDLFPYNIANAEDPQLKTYQYENGGYVILTNNITTTQINNSFIILDVHWRQTEFPQIALSAANYVLDLAGPHRISLDLSEADLVVEKTDFLESPAWHVTGWWNPENTLGDPRPNSPLDWIVFECPESDMIWTILITTDDISYLDDLRSIRESFRCPLD